MGWYTIDWESRPAKGECLVADGGEFDGDVPAVKWAKGMLRRRAASGVAKGTLYERTAGEPERVVTYLSGRG